MTLYFREYDSAKGVYEQHLGQVVADKPTRVVFHKTEDCKKVKSLSASCGCTEPVDKENSINVTFTPRSGVKEVNKSITVTFEDNTKVILFIKAKVV